MKKLLEKLRRDSWGMGILLGAGVPAITFGILYAIFAGIMAAAGHSMDKDLICKVILLSVVPSVFVMRYYLLKLKYDYTGRGILLMTFVIAIIFCVLEFLVG